MLGASIERVADVGNCSGETITPTGDVDNISGAGRMLAERIAERIDVNPQTAFFYGNARPDAFEKVMFADGFAGLLGEDAQNIERASAQRHDSVRLF
jgi:hypothetical protein